MIKFLIIDDDMTRALIGLGITKRNVELLMNDKPMMIKVKEDLGFETPTPIDILIFYGEDEAAITSGLQELIGPETKVSISDLLKGDLTFKKM